MPLWFLQLAPWLLAVLGPIIAYLVGRQSRDE